MKSILELTEVIDLSNNNEIDKVIELSKKYRNMHYGNIKIFDCHGFIFLIKGKKVFYYDETNYQGEMVFKNVETRDYIRTSFNESIYNFVEGE